MIAFSSMCPSAGEGRPLGAVRAFCVEYGWFFRTACAFCWCMLFFYHAFDFDSRFWRVPLVAFTLPVLVGLPYSGVCRHLARSPLAWAVLAMVTAVCIATVFSPVQEKSSYTHLIFGWFVLALSGFALYLAMPAKAVRLMLGASVLGLVAASAYALLCSLVGWEPAGEIFLFHRLQLFAGYPTALGHASGYATVGLFYCLWHKRPVFTRRLDMLALLPIVRILLLSQSRNALFAVVGACAVLAVLDSSRPMRTIVLLALLLLLCTGCFWALGKFGPLQNTILYQRMEILVSDPLKDKSTLGRIGIWDISWRCFKERPLTGYGMRLYGYAHLAYQKKHEAELMAKYCFLEKWAGHSHNIFLGTLTESGLLGLIPLLIIFASALFAKNAPRGSDRDWLRMLFLYFLFQGCADYMFYKIMYTDIFFGLTGLLMGTRFFLNNEQHLTAHSPQ